MNIKNKGAKFPPNNFLAVLSKTSSPFHLPPDINSPPFRFNFQTKIKIRVHPPSLDSTYKLKLKLKLERSLSRFSIKIKIRVHVDWVQCQLGFENKNRVHVD